MTEFMTLVFLVYVGSTLAMFGVIWFAQIIHYPLYAKVGPEEFSLYQEFNLRRTVLIVIPLQLLEL